MVQCFPIKNLQPRFAAVIVLIFLACGPVLSQSKPNGSRNNPYSPSPDRKARPEVPAPTPLPLKPATSEVAFVMQIKSAPPENRPTIAQQTFNIAKAAETSALPPTQIYRVGVGDVLLVNLKNSVQGSGYYTVRIDGTIDFPLAGENVVVADQTVENIEEIVASGITLFSDPQIEVKVREYASHRITVSGMVDNPGPKNLQREAMPLYAIKAEAVADPKATKAVITRAPLLKLETYDLRDANTDNILIYPGNSIEFTTENGNLRHTGTVFYFISGEITLAGQKELTSGITLYQAVIASGGTTGPPKKAVIRRKNEKGMFTITEHNLRSIKDGKTADPSLSPGDVIEIGN